MASTDIAESSTVIETVKYSVKHTMVIKDFSIFYANTEGDAKPEYLRICSEPFYCLQDRRIQFKLQISPRGKNADSKDYISVFLFATFQKMVKTTIKFKLSILHVDNKSCFSAELTRLFAKSANRGWKQFISRKSLLDKTRGWLPNDQLTLLAELDIYPEPFSKLTSNAPLEKLKLSAIEESATVYGNLLNSGDLSDVILEVGGEKLKAHQVILAAHSPVFRAMFEVNMKEKTEGRVEIEDLTVEVVKALLKFIYTGKVELSDDLAKGLLSAADKYELTKLKQICSQFLCRKVKKESVIRLLVLADRHSVDQLKKVCIEFIRIHWAEVALADTWPLVDKLVMEELRQRDAASSRKRKAPQT